jgi:NodT family efflux transporter outer membrane factor (OMF) lipoprotein
MTTHHSTLQPQRLHHTSAPQAASAMRWPRQLVAGVLVTSLLAACASPGPAHQPLALRSPSTLGLSNAPSTSISPQWWTALGDAQLSQLIEQALREHPSLAQAQARVAQAQSVAQLSRAANSPQLTLGADLTRQRYSANGLTPAPIAGSTQTSGNLQAGLNWSPDLFGGQAAQLAAALGQARATQADAAAAATTLAANISHSYIALARLLGQREGAELALTQRRAIVDLTRQRRHAGLDADTQLMQAEGVLQDTQAQIEALNEQISLTRHQLATLSGLAPQSLDELSPSLKQLSLPPPTSPLGMDLLGRRPDVVAARWRVEASLHNVEQARTQFYPNVNLGAFVGFNALSLGQLLEASSRQLGVTPALRLPLFDGGLLRAQLQGKQADLDLAIAQYNQVLLDAVKEASNALSTDQSLTLQWQAQSAARDSARAVYVLTQQRYRAGLLNQLAVLDAENATLMQRHLAVDLYTRQLDARVSLMTALGGGWQGDAATPATPTTPTPTLNRAKDKHTNAAAWLDLP